MTEFNNSNSHKGTIEGNDGVKLTVVRNTTFAGNVSENALWLKREGAGNGFYDVYGIDAARELHRNIGIVLDELDQIVEDAKPKALTQAELGALIPGTRVYGHGAYGETVWMRTEQEGMYAFIRVEGMNVGSYNSDWALGIDGVAFAEREEK